MKKKLLILVPAVFAVAVGVAGLMQAGSGTPGVEAAHNLTGSPLTQTHAPGTTGITVAIVGTAPAGVNQFHIAFSYDSTLLSPSDGPDAGTAIATCGTAPSALVDFTVAGVADVLCADSGSATSEIYTAGPQTLATVEFCSKATWANGPLAAACAADPGPVGTSTQVTLAWQFLDNSGGDCIDGHLDTAAPPCDSAGTNPLGGITIAAATATNTPAPTNTPTPVPALGIEKVPASANIWLCKTGLLCTGVGGFGAIKLQEQLFNGSDTGLGAYELQVKYDHKVFDIIIGDGDGTCVQPPLSLQLCPNPLAANALSTAGGPWHSFLGSTSRGVSCGSIITENYTTFGCASLAGAYDANGNPIPWGPHGDSGPANLGQCSDPSSVPLLPAATPKSAVGSINPAVAPFLTPAAIQPLFANFNCPPLATVSVSPDADMFFRIRPTSMNGVVRTLLDENCEAADVWGSPLPGSIQGGLTPTCADSTLTVRMLEGDVNLDCTVGILDAGIMAFKYGSFFGSLLYDPFFDLEPKLTDFDIDIKDIQFVTGRFGSTCVFAIPPQPPAAPIP